jgi:hypothetical protein
LGKEERRNSRSNEIAAPAKERGAAEDRLLPRWPTGSCSLLPSYAVGWFTMLACRTAAKQYNNCAHTYALARMALNANACRERRCLVCAYPFERDDRQGLA